MKKALLLAAFLVLLPYSFAMALSVGITEADPKGSNARAQPTTKSEVVYVYAYPENPDELYTRKAYATKQQGNWVNVYLPTGEQAWLHTSLLGFCAGYNEKTPCVIRTAPQADAKAVDTPKEGVQLDFEQLGEGWAKVSYVKNRKKITGWLPQVCLTSSGFCPAGKESTLTFRNKAGIFTALNVSVKNQVETRVVGLDIMDGQSISIRKPANEVSELDFYMGMSNDVHFVFKEVPVQSIDTVVLTYVNDNEPMLEMFHKGTSKGTIKGEFVAEDLS